MKRFLWKTISVLLQAVLIVILPFVLLIRGTVWLYTSYEWPWGLALLLMGAAVFLVLLVYIAVVRDVLIGPKKMSRRGRRGYAMLALLLVMGYAGFSFFNLKGRHAKSDAVQEEYNSLHPMLRIAVGTVIILDDGLLVTDLSRAKAEYKEMGLKTIQHSLHYPQENGWVHAMDIRTIGRSEFRNRLIQGYFWMMGFNTLRHDGTADHLHIS
ncbi:MAG: hypothetical protein AAF399_29280, partial [Bacteroidota bacterium]